jgi:hypothetical protein
MDSPGKAYALLTGRGERNIAFLPLGCTVRTVPVVLVVPLVPVVLFPSPGEGGRVGSGEGPGVRVRAGLPVSEDL